MGPGTAGLGTFILTFVAGVGIEDGFSDDGEMGVSVIRVGVFRHGCESMPGLITLEKDICLRGPCRYKCLDTQREIE